MPGLQPDDPFEGRIVASLRDAGSAFDADRGALADGGLKRGRRMRARRQRAAVLGGAAGMALVGVGGALLVAGGGPGGDDRPVAAASAPVGGEPGTGVSAAPGSVSGEEVVRTLKKLLPRGEFRDEQGRGTDARYGPSAHVVFDDGRGAAAVGLVLGRVEPGSARARDITRCPDKELVAHQSCTSSTLPDGSRLMLLKGFEYPDRRAETKLWTAELVTPEGQHVGVSEWNAPAQKDAPVSRPEPPLSQDQLTKVVTAPQWRAVVDAIPRRDAPATPRPESGAERLSVRRTLTALLPARVEVVAKGGQESEYGFVVVDDGKGRTFVQVNVQRGMGDTAGELFGPDAETRPDGTLVASRQGPGEKGAEGVVMWTVDTLRTDGGRVVISAFNSGAQHEDATRAPPALTMKELRAMALAPEWDALLGDSGR